MIVTTETTIGFRLPQEFQQALKFGEENKDWVRYEDTMYITYSKTQMYSAELKGDGEA